ncbi:MAG: sn-glycerol-3-phosphate ABC transporter ATP-binding protein UgpC [Actinobacteria bacterium]|nr:sn-glycerol-3-phosphate ABC transporter ATP-binding protein UgpC [Actinomycetota bacterium]
MSTVSFRDVEKRYSGGTAAAVNRLNLDIEDGEFMVFVGPSGCGKTTALRMTAGLETISGGEIAIDGERVNDVTPQRRDIAMVFQEYALYPQMNVFDNIAFGLRLRRLPRQEIRTRVEEMARTLGMEDLLKRKPRALSGGQRQRVAMGRALVRDPKVFLMDEPLSNLDAKLRVQMRYEVTRIQRELGTTTIYVTHDQVEAMTMGTRVAVMRGGDLQQVDQPEALYEEPSNLFVAAFIGSPEMNLLPCTVVGGDGGLGLQIGEQRLPLTEGALARHPALRSREGAELILGLRPEALSEPGVESPTERLRGEVTAAEMLGADRLVHVEIASAPTVSGDLIEETGTVQSANGSPRVGRGSAVVARFDAQGARPDPGERLELAVSLDRAHFFDPSTGERI